jgi:predicted transcriptional regulator
MKAITINVSDPIYSDFVRYSKKVHRPASEIIRSAMEEFHAKRIARSTSLRQRRRPASVGGPVMPLTAQDDLLGEMMDHDARD